MAPDVRMDGGGGDRGRIEYKGEPGPFGFKPDDAEKSLKHLVDGG